MKVSDGFIIDLETNEFTKVPEGRFLSARSNAKAFHFNSRVYVWGGLPADGNSNSGAVFDTEKKAWEPMAEIPVPEFRELTGAEMVMLEPRGLVLTGGRLGSGRFNDDVWIFEFSSKRWIKIIAKNPPQGRIAHCTVATGRGEIAVFGGMGTDPGSRTLSQFDGIWLLKLDE
ncbi:MAG: hypothetical protein HQK54_17235 [Oligoflexales bacterium]|nr:hypothetical protein [Oligoflexales bacterium]